MSLETPEAPTIGRTTSGRPAEGGRGLPPGALALGDRAARGDRLPRRDPRPDRAPADGGGSSRRRSWPRWACSTPGGARDQQPAGLLANNLAVLDAIAAASRKCWMPTSRPTRRWRRPAPSLPGGLTRSVRRSTCPTSGRTWGSCSAAHGRGSDASPASWRTCGRSPGSIRPPSIGWTCSRRSPAAWR